MRLIDADAFDKMLSDVEIEAGKCRKYILKGAINTIRGNLAKMPTIEPEQKTGKWIPIGDVDSDNNQLYECNQCHHSDLHAVNVDVPYCWYCGAKMEGDEE